jgi:hypothetical protein
MARRAILGCVLLVVVACGSTPVEQQLLTQFFRAARVRDNTALASMSAVNFDPRTEGSVEDFKIDSIGDRSAGSCSAGVRRRAGQDSRRPGRIHQEDARLLSVQLHAIDRGMKADQAKQPVRGKDASCWRMEEVGRDSRDLERKLSQARQKVARERSTPCQPDDARP